MGWFWGNSKDDPVNKLDPGLRDYLQRETRTQDYVPTTQSQEPRKPVDAPSHAPQPRAPEAAEPSTPAVPSASLFPDGRYAHIWKNYKPPTNPEEVGVRSVERVIDKYKERKDSVQRAAMENCALEQEELAHCFRTGDWQKRLKARVTLCSAENSNFARCFSTQAKFLQALGYASSFDPDSDREERVQMHADKLYHQMLDYEKQVEAAKEAGQEPPPLTSLFNPQAKTRIEKPSSKSDAVEIPGGEQLPDGFTPSKELERLTPHERELEIHVHKAQMDQQQLYAEKASPFMKSQDDAKQKRREKASSWLGDTLAKWIS